MNINNSIKYKKDFFPSHPEINKVVKEELFKSGLYEREKDFSVLLKKSINLWESFNFKEPVKIETKDGKTKEVMPDYSSFISAACHWFSEEYFDLVIDKAITHQPENISLSIKNDLIVACILNNKPNALEKLVEANVLTEKNLTECLFVYKTYQLFRLNDAINFKDYKTIVHCWQNIEDKQWGYILNKSHTDIYQNMEIILGQWNTLLTSEQKQEIAPDLLNLFIQVRLDYNDDYKWKRYTSLSSVVAKLIEFKFLSVDTLLNKEGKQVDLQEFFDFSEYDIKAFKIPNQEFKAEQMHLKLSGLLDNKNKQTELIKI
jgi:hypothetical protein